MVRRVTGALVRVGSGELDPETCAALIDADAARLARLPGGAPQPAEWTAPPSGLFLERVLYPGDPPLPPLAVPVVAVP
jgi:tRNA pseudouridine38-40 synthase